MSSDISDTEPSPIPPSAGVIVDERGRLASDLQCWTCEYNLRTLAVGAGCPECGTPVAYTLEQRDGRRIRPFSLFTITPVSRTLGLIFGMAFPALIVIFAGSMPSEPINTDWQSGEIEEIVGVMLSGRAMWAFYPFLLWAYIAFTAVMSAPITMGRQWWTKAGLWLGCILGLQYQLILNINFFGLDEEFWIALIIGLIPLGVLAGIVALNIMRDKYRTAKPRGKRPWWMITLQIVVTVVVLVVIAYLTSGVVFIFVLISGPYMMLLCMSATLCRLYRTDFAPPARRSTPLPVAATAVGYAGAWPIAITQGMIVYSSLPTSPPGCYVCTASAYGHRWLTRPVPIQFPDGRVLLVTKQMRILKAAEERIAKHCPRLHQAMRGVYDHVGPRIAQRIQSRWLADVSYLLFTPIAVVAWVVLTLLGRTSEIERAYRG